MLKNKYQEKSFCIFTDFLSSFFFVANCEKFILNSIKLSSISFFGRMQPPFVVENVSVVFASQRKLLWIFCFCLLSTRTPQQEIREGGNSRFRKFTFLALRHKINYYQIRGRFFLTSQRKPRNKSFPQLLLKTSLRNLCFPALRHISIHSTLIQLSA